MSRRCLLAIAVMLAACERAPAPEPSKVVEPPKGLPEIRKAKAGVEKAQKAAEQRTDQALDRAMQGEQVDRGAVPR